MSDFVLKQDDTSPAIKYQLQDSAGNAIDLSGINGLKFLMRPHGNGNLKVDADQNSGVSVVNASEGTVRYNWSASDTDTSGTYEAEWEVTYSDNTVETFPNNDYIIVSIDEDLG